MGPTNSGVSPVLVESVECRFRGFALGPLTFTLDSGVTALLGENGAGKTTLMKMLVGALAPSAGTVQWAGTPPRAGAGYLPQAFEAMGGATVAEYLGFVAWVRSTRRNAIGVDDISEALEAADLRAKENSKIKHLSGGMLRRLGLAQALLGTSSLLVLDEPTVGLDPMQRRDVRALVENLGRDRAVLVSTHLAEDVVAIADRVIVMHQGQVVFDGSVRDLCAPREESAEALEDGLVALLNKRQSCEGDAG